MARITLCEPCGWAWPCGRGHTEGRHEAVTALLPPDADTGAIGSGRWAGGTNAINGVRFAFSSSNIVSGKIVCSGRLAA